MNVDHLDRRRAETFVHSAVIAETDEEMVAALEPQLRRGVTEYDEVLLVVGERIRSLLGERVSDLDEVVRWADPAAFYQRLGFAYEGFRRYLAAQADAGRRVLVVAEPDLADSLGAGRGVDRASAYLAYEAACNDTYAPYGSAVTCVWGSRHHPASVLDGVRVTHSHLLTAAGLQPSPTYVPPGTYLARRVPLLPPPDHVDHDWSLTEVRQLSGLRRSLGAWAAAHHFADEPADDLVVAVVEVASNGLRHAATPVRVRTWHQEGTLIVQCDDSGGIPVPPTAGYHRPDITAALPGGRGLWLARQLADVVHVDSVPGRTSVRLLFPHAVMHRHLA
ncbi:ATP-binding protein [Actinoplanes sp. NPDC023936]|uniref:ATP-binding protein n=1 Tax=Actinoplanes sp. NPDC023936 TaxID=3154910 RepID=UPI0033E17211